MKLADPATADYGVLLANAQGLPGREFFWRYRVLHADEYEVTVGSEAFAPPTGRAVAHVEDNFSLCISARPRHLHARHELAARCPQA